MQTESNTRPNKFDIENIINGNCEIVFYDNIQEIEKEVESGKKEKAYIYDMYRIKTTFRENLAEELENDKEKYQKWLQLAKTTEERTNADIEIAKLQEELDSTDYKIIKCSEYQLAGLDIPYNIAELHTKRQILRDRINELQEL